MLTGSFRGFSLYGPCTWTIYHGWWCLWQTAASHISMKKKRVTGSNQGQYTPTNLYMVTYILARPHLAKFPGWYQNSIINWTLQIWSVSLWGWRISDLSCTRQLQIFANIEILAIYEVFTLTPGFFKTWYLIMLQSWWQALGVRNVECSQNIQGWSKFCQNPWPSFY